MVSGRFSQPSRVLEVNHKRILCNNEENIDGENFLLKNKAIGTGECIESDKPEIFGQIGTLLPGGLQR
jgi:hypothetical protein